MKKYLAYSLLVAVLFGNSGAGCGSKSEEPQPNNFQSLIGKWQLQRTLFEGTKHDGTDVTINSEVKENGGIYIYEFFSDGRLRATGNGKSRDIRWELNVTRLSGTNIDTGKLKIIGDEERQLAASTGQTGDLTFDISTSGNNFSIMYLSVDATKLEADDYKKVILTYTYHTIN